MSDVGIILRLFMYIPADFGFVFSLCNEIHFITGRGDKTNPIWPDIIIRRPPRYSWNIVESDVKHNNPTTLFLDIVSMYKTVLILLIACYYSLLNLQKCFWYDKLIIESINILLTSPEHLSSLPFLVGYDKLIIVYYHLFIPPEYLRSPPVFSDVRVVRSLVVSVVLCGSLFVVLLFSIVLYALLRFTASDYTFGIFQACLTVPSERY